MDKLYSSEKARDVRDAVAKALYSRMFHWLVARLNSYLQPSETKDLLTIGRRRCRICYMMVGNVSTSLSQVFWTFLGLRTSRTTVLSSSA